MTMLDGLRVLDLSPTRVGAQISQTLADFGADVIWVEPPGGAELRDHPAAPFWARGKRSIVLDLKQTSEVAVLRELCDSADVLIDTFSPGVLQRLGLDPADLQISNPRLIHASITGFGATGPYSDIPGYEGLVFAKLGVLHAFAGASNTDGPVAVTAPFGAFAASQIALHGVLAALHERESSGLGQRVETSLAHAFTSIDTWAWIEHIIADRWPEAFNKLTNFDDEGCPNSPFSYFLMVALTKDGTWLQFASVAPHLFQATMKALGLADMFTDPEWEGLPVFEDQDKRMLMWTKMLEAAKQKTLSEWEAIFDEDPNVFAEMFRAGPVALDHPQLDHDKLIVDIVDQEHGSVRQPGPLANLSKSPAILGSSAPILNQHGELIRSELAEAKAASDTSTNNSTTATGSTSSSATGTLPLAGVTILELAVLFAAPHGATMLTDLGARVIKVEPLEGDPIRTIITFPESGGAKVMQGKDSICVDMRTPEGLKLVHELTKVSDIVLQGFRAGATTRLGVDYETLSKINPDIIYVNAPGYGVDGPYGHRPAYAPSIGAATGLARANLGNSVREAPDMSIEEIRDSSRRLTQGGTLSNAQADGFAALGVASAVLLGLTARDRGAGGQELSTSMINTGVHAMSAQTVDYPASMGEASPGPDLLGLGPLYRLYRASDGWVFLATPSERGWKRLTSGIVKDLDLTNDSRFASVALRNENAEALTEVLATMFATKPKAQWESDMLAADIGCVAVHDQSIESALFDDSFAKDSGLAVEVTHPTFEEHLRIAPYIRFSRSSTQALPGVLAGQSTDKILTEMGHTKEDLSRLREDKIVG